MTYEKNGLFVDEEHLESYGENCARSLKPLGRTGGGAYAAELRGRGLDMVDMELTDSGLRMPYVDAPVGRLYLKQLLETDRAERIHRPESNRAHCADQDHGPCIGNEFLSVRPDNLLQFQPHVLKILSDTTLFLRFVSLRHICSLLLTTLFLCAGSIYVILLCDLFPAIKKYISFIGSTVSCVPVHPAEAIDLPLKA